MKRFLSRTAGWFPGILVIVGCLAMASGLLSIKVFTVSSAGMPLPSHAAVYVGGGTCYTCHQSDYTEWAVPLDLQAMADEAAKPKRIVAEVKPREDVRRMERDKSGDGCVLDRDAGPSAGSAIRQYIVRTDAGDALLPRDWNEGAFGTLDNDGDEAASVDCTLEQPIRESSILQLISQGAATAARRSRIDTLVTNLNPQAFVRLRVPSETAFVEGQST